MAGKMEEGGRGEGGGGKEEAVAKAEEEEDWEALEYHMHVYFDAEDPTSVQNAMRIRAALLDRVDRGLLKVMLDGVPEDSSAAVEAGDAVERPPPVNMTPVGPHPCASYEVWCPKESFAECWSFMLRERRGATIFIHPLTGDAMRDHTEHAVFLGETKQLNLQALPRQGGDDPQYVYLKLGCSAQLPT